MRLCPEVEVLPVLHGRQLFAREVQKMCLTQKFDCIAVDIPPQFEDDLGPAVDSLPYISAVIAKPPQESWYYIPTDPCDPCIEGIRQARQNHIPFRCIGSPVLKTPSPLQDFPDEYAIEKIGFDTYSSLCLLQTGLPPKGSDEDLASFQIASALQDLKLYHKNTLALIHVKHFSATIRYFLKEESHNHQRLDHPVDIETRLINPDHLYFALGELPFVTAKFEMERQDIFSTPTEMIEVLKDLFRETRDSYYEEKDQSVLLSPARIQASLTFLRNLTVISGRLLPTLFDIVEAAKGVGGNTFALKILKGAKYYPYLPFEKPENLMGVGIDKITLTGDSYQQERETFDAVNLLRDIAMEWRTLSIKPDPSQLQKKQYKYSWNPFGMCSHVPEDSRIENFNNHVRTKALRTMNEHLAKTEKFSSSVKDGIDIRETLRNWHTGSIYVRELPPVKNKVDTVIIIFDDNHDEKYPHRTAWYAEHDQESTLTFYATDPFEDLVGPGIARCTYGGLSLLFPPRTVPSAFDLTKNMDLPNCAAQLTFGALMFSREKAVAYVASKSPNLRLRTMASKFGKHLVWIPLSTFSNETINKLKRFHILNGKDVRSWVTRFIGD